jgi:hypothetical protein
LRHRSAADILCCRPEEILRPADANPDIWLVSFMDCDLGYFDLETRVLETLENPFGPKVLPMS